jgi:mono/diheme cytochrome c family protein
VVSGYPDQAMPGWYGRKLSAAALDRMAAYLEALTDKS